MINITSILTLNPASASHILWVDCLRRNNTFHLVLVVIHANYNRSQNAHLRHEYSIVLISVAILTYFDLDWNYILDTFSNQSSHGGWNLINIPEIEKWGCQYHQSVVKSTWLYTLNITKIALNVKTIWLWVFQIFSSISEEDEMQYFRQLISVVTTLYKNLKF